MAWLIIIVNVYLLYRLFTTLQFDDDSYYQVGAIVAYMLQATFASVILYIIFRITENRK